PGRAQAAREVDSPGLPSVALTVAAEEDFLAVGTPQGGEELPPLFRQTLLAAGSVDDADGAALIVALRMIDKGDQVPLRRDSQSGEITSGLVQHLSDRV